MRLSMFVVNRFLHPVELAPALGNTQDSRCVRDIRKFERTFKTSGQSPYWIHTENVEGKQTTPVCWLWHCKIIWILIPRLALFACNKATRHERWFEKWVITNSCHGDPHSHAWESIMQKESETEKKDFEKINFAHVRMSLMMLVPFRNTAKTSASIYILPYDCVRCHVLFLILFVRRKENYGKL